MEKQRAETDESLRVERDDADRTIRDMQAAMQAAVQAAEQVADEVLDLARLEADAVLVAARDKADRDSAALTASNQAGVELERARADEVVQDARVAADDLLRSEREAGGLSLAELLPLEREHTDRDLLTERARSDLAVAQRDDFLAIVSHDLRNLLGGILFSSSRLSQKALETGERTQIVATGKRIQLYAARMNRLIGDLLDVASIDAGRLACAIVPADPQTLIAETVDTFRCLAEEKGIELVAQVAGTLPLASFDHGRMLQVFANLVSNALKFTPRGGKVRIGGEHSGDEVHLSVSDTGVGIPETMRDLVFLRFWQAATDDRRGTGLGLYISKSMVEAHRGRIWIESNGGRGSVFHFTLPVVQ